MSMLTLLIVDDEPLILAGVRQMVREQQGTHFTNVLVSADAFEALDMLDRCTPDLVITDIQMPGMNGLDFIREAKQKHCRRFIVLTGHDYFDYALQALRHGVIDYLMKPLNRDALYELLTRVSKQILEERLGSDKLDGPAFDPHIPAKIREFHLYLLTHFSRDISLGEVASRLNLHPNYVSRLLKEHTGQTFLQHLHALRMEKARNLLEHSTLSLAHIAKGVGFENAQQFYKLFKRDTGMTPGEYRDSHRRERYE